LKDHFEVAKLKGRKIKGREKERKERDGRDGKSPDKLLVTALPSG